MTLYKNTDPVLTFNMEDRCEKIASQEEVYLEETEEELRTSLISSASNSVERSYWIAVETHTDREISLIYGRPSPHQGSVLDEQAILEQQRARAAADLLTGDSDDAPISEDTLSEMLESQN